MAVVTMGASPLNKLVFLKEMSILQSAKKPYNEDRILRLNNHLCFPLNSPNLAHPSTDK